MNLRRSYQNHYQNSFFQQEKLKRLYIKKIKFFRNRIFFEIISEEKGFFFLTKKRKIDVLLHELVPKHYLLTKEESLNLLEKYQINISDLPQMSEKDPVSIAIGAKEGDIVKIVRESHTTVKNINYYRYIKKEKI